MNFSGLSVFVLVGCPLSTLLLSETLASPVCTLLTPLEHTLACGPEHAWQPLFLFGEIKPVENDEEDDSQEEEKEVSTSHSGALVLTAGDTARQLALVSPAAAALRAPGRWVGVDPAAPTDAPAPPVEGRSGIASGYEDEPKL